MQTHYPEKNGNVEEVSRWQNKMKLLFENWRRYLKEQRTFGQSFEQWLHGEKAGCEPETNSPDCLKDYGFKLLGDGSWRNTYSLPDNDDVVIKMVDPVLEGSRASQGKEMNKVEADSILNTGFSDLLPKFYESADDYNWILVERVYPIPNNWMEIYFPELSSVASKINTFYNNLPSELLIELLDDTREAVRETGDYKNFNIQLYGAPKKTEAEAKTLKNKIIKAMNPLFKRILQFSLETGSANWDIREANIGVSSDGRFIMLDPGIGIDKSSEATALSNWSAPKRKKILDKLVI